MGVEIGRARASDVRDLAVAMMMVINVVVSSWEIWTVLGS